MRRLILLRHGKADPHDHREDRDQLRPLTSRGRADAERAGAYLAREGLTPDLALVSDSVRTRETYDCAAKSFPVTPAMRLEPVMYRAQEEDLLELIRAVEDTVATLLLVGHNPEFAALAAALAGSGAKAALAAIQAKFPTSSLAIIDFEAAHWRDIREDGGRLDRFVTPADIGGEEGD